MDRAAQIEAIRVGIADHRTLTDIAGDIGISPSTASALAKEAGIAVRGRSPRVRSAIPSSMAPADLRAWRKGHCLTQPDACKLLGISLRPYQHAENGNTRGGFKVPKVPRLIELATKGLDVELRLVRYRMGQLSSRAGDGKQGIPPA
jgi:DNA-binding XRE family transcriptional regulator